MHPEPDAALREDDQHVGARRIDALVRRCRPMNGRDDLRLAAGVR
jgi:hypothetical protein